MSLLPSIRQLPLLVGLLTAAACGSPTQDGPPPPPPPATGLGPAGGTVSGPNGAQVVVPAGALAANTAIGVAESSAGSPPLPAGLATFGPMFAFTPHGTTFAVPVTITVPFDPASVPAGVTPLLYKTNPAGAWEQVANATINGATMTGAVTGFSWGATAGPVPPVIDSNPKGQSVTAPAAATFSVTANLSPGTSGTLTYQWQKADDAVTFVSLVGATAISYTTGPTTVASDNGDYYRVVVTNGTSVVSNAVRLTVTPDSAPGTWQPVGGVLATGPPANATPDLFAAVALNNAGHPVVAWKGRLAGPGTSTSYINVMRWTGSNWVQLGGNLQLSNRNGDRYSTPSIDIDPKTGHPVVAWAEESARTPIGSFVGAFDVYVKRWNGTAWVQLGGALNADPAAGAVYPKLRVDNAGMPTVAWWETPNNTEAKRWNGSAWSSLGPQPVSRATGAQQSSLTALTVDSIGNPLVAFGMSGGPGIVTPSGGGWSPLPSFRTDGPTASAWGVAIDSLGRLTVGYSTFSGTNDLVRVRRYDNGAWTDVGGTLFTDASSTLVQLSALAVPFGTSQPIATWLASTSSGPSINHVQSFRQWDGTVWKQVAHDLSAPCALAVPTNATNAAAAPVVACVRPAGNEDIVVYRLVP